MKFKVSIKGIAPLLHDRFPEEEFINKSRQGGKKKAEDLPQAEEEKALYKNEKGELIIPTNMFLGAMKKGATSYKLEGKKTYKDLVRGGVFIDEEYSVLKGDERKWTVLARALKKNTGTTIMKYNPKFEKWSANFTLTCLDDRATTEALHEILKYSGAYCGIGGWHPRYGRFEVTKFTEVK